jgi:alkylation response protein AidB-like acyl-CoA dehydrogenase
MDFGLTEEQQIFLDSVKKFAQKNLAKDAIRRANSNTFPWDVSEMFAKQGLLGITIPEEKGGLGGTLLDAILAIQAVAEFCPKSADVVQAGNFGAIRTFAEYATEYQRNKFLPQLLSGKAVMSVGMSEPDAGSAVTELKTSAKIVGDEVVLNGAKIYGTNSTEADVFLVYVRFEDGLNGIGSVLIEKGTTGFSIGKSVLFMNGEAWAPLYFENCKVPKENILLGVGGFKKQISGFNVERLGNAARAVAIGNYAFNLAKNYALTRKQFGRDLCDFQGLQWKFAEMVTKLESAQLLLFRAVCNSIDGLPSANDTAIAKYACNEAGYFAANESMQIMGAAGFSEDSLAQYCVKRTRGWMIAGGSVEILKNRIAEGVFDRKFSQRK